MKDIGVMIIDLELEKCMIDMASIKMYHSGIMVLRVIAHLQTVIIHLHCST